MISQEKPDVVIHCAVLQTWHVIRALPQDIYAQLSAATLGAWTPCQVALALKLMQAIKLSGIKPKVVNTALSCEVNPMLASVDLPADIGIEMWNYSIPDVDYWLLNNSMFHRQ